VRVYVIVCDCLVVLIPLSKNNNRKLPVISRSIDKFLHVILFIVLSRPIGIQRNYYSVRCAIWHVLILGSLPVRHCSCGEYYIPDADYFSNTTDWPNCRQKWCHWHSHKCELGGELASFLLCFLFFFRLLSFLFLQNFSPLRTFTLSFFFSFYQPLSP